MKKNEKIDVLNIYESGRVIRYHSNPIMSRLQQNDADHSWGCAALLFALHPDPSRELIKGAIFHDSGERWAGDMPYPAKRRNPELASQHAAVEDELAAENGIPLFSLNREEKRWLKFVDRLESHLLAFLYEPRMIECDGFVAQAKTIREEAVAFGCEDKLEKIL